MINEITSRVPNKNINKLENTFFKILPLILELGSG